MLLAKFKKYQNSSQVLDEDDEKEGIENFIKSKDKILIVKSQM
jgi:hypothetical protein